MAKPYPYVELSIDSGNETGMYSLVEGGEVTLSRDLKYAFNAFGVAVLFAADSRGEVPVTATTGTITLEVQLVPNGRWVELTAPTGVINAVDADIYAGEISGRFYSIRARCETLDVPYVTVRLLIDQ